jgi:hypothetical protein
MTRGFEARLTASDRQWLMDMDKAMQEPLPAHVVSMKQYLAAIDSNEYITRENFRLRKEYHELEDRFRDSEAKRWVWRNGALLALVFLGAMCAFWIGRSW